MKCPNCHNELPNEAKFCLHCGTRIEVDNTTVECPSCHARIPKDSKFCPDCGEKIVQKLQDDSQYYFPYIAKNGLIGFKDIRTDEIIIKAEYIYASLFHEGFAVVKRERGDYFFIDSNNGKLKTYSIKNGEKDFFEWWPDRYSCFSNGCAISYDSTIKLDGEFTSFTELGLPETIVSYKHQDGLVAIKDGGIIDPITGKIVLSKDYKVIFRDWISDRIINDGLILVEHKPTRKYGYFNKDGEEIIPCKYDYALPFHEGVASVKDRSHNCYHCIDTKGNVLFSREQLICTCYEGLMAVNCPPPYPAKVAILCDYVDKKGRVVLSHINNSAEAFVNGRLCCGDYYIGKNGQKVDFKLNCFRRISKHFYAARLNKGWEISPECVCDSLGKVLTPYCYEKLSKLNEGLLIGRNVNGNEEFIDIWGNSTLSDWCRS